MLTDLNLITRPEVLFPRVSNCFTREYGKMLEVCGYDQQDPSAQQIVENVRDDFWRGPSDLGLAEDTVWVATAHSGLRTFVLRLDAFLESVDGSNSKSVRYIRAWLRRKGLVGTAAIMLALIGNCELKTGEDFDIQMGLSAEGVSIEMTVPIDVGGMVKLLMVRTQAADLGLSIDTVAYDVAGKRQLAQPSQRVFARPTIAAAEMPSVSLRPPETRAQPPAPSSLAPSSPGVGGRGSFRRPPDIGRRGRGI